MIGLAGSDTDVTAFRELTEQFREAEKKLTEEKLYLDQEIVTELGFGEIIGRSKALRAVSVHQLSGRAGNGFIELNCAAIPSGLLESELFGNERGAFTGAVSKKIGRLELADKGTLVLDKIGEISLELQPKLLRVLEDQEFKRLGGTQTVKVDFRLIAATNRDLVESVRESKFVATCITG